MAILKYAEDAAYITYYNDVGKHTLLTIDEERALFKRYHTCPHCSTPFSLKVKRTNCPECSAMLDPDATSLTVTCTKCSTKFERMAPPKACLACGAGRDLDARDKIIVSNLRFVIKRAQALTRDPDRRNFLISAGNLGLLIAIDKYTIERGTRFLTYAEWWIRKEMYDAINSSSLIHIPPQKRRAILKELKDGKYVCVHCGLRVNAEYECTSTPCLQEEHKFLPPDASTHSLLGHGLELEKSNLTDDTDIEGGCISEDMRSSLKEALLDVDFSERDRYILLGYYNIAAEDRKSEAKNLKQLSALLGITPERVRQLKTKALSKVKKELMRHGNLVSLF